MTIGSPVPHRGGYLLAEIVIVALFGLSIAGLWFISAEAAIVALIASATSAAIWLGIRIGSRCVDRMLLYSPPDPNKPIVRRHPLDP